MVLYEFRNFSVPGMQTVVPLKGNLLGQRAVLLQQLDRVRMVGAKVGAVGNSHAGFKLVPATPLLVRRLIDRPELVLVGGPGPGVEVVAPPSFRGNEHVFRPLAVRVAIKSRVAEHRAQQRTKSELVAVIGAHGYAPQAIDRKSGRQ